MGAERRKLLVPDRQLILPRGFDRRRIARPMPWIWVPKRFAPRMAVGFDTSGGTDNAGSAVLTFTNSFTIGSSLVNGGILGWISVGASFQIVSPTMTWAGTSMFLITTIFDAGAGSLALFGLTNPTGGTKNMVATWTTNSGGVAMGFWSFSGVDQTGGATTFINATTSTNGGTTSSQTQAVTTANGNATVFGWAPGQVFTGTQTPTPDWQRNTTGAPFGEGQHILSTSTSDSYTATMSAVDVLIGCGCSIKAAAGTTPAVVDTPRRRYSYR